MSQINFTVHWKNGDQHDFQASNVTTAFIRALAYTLVTKKPSDIEFIVDDANCKIYFKWDWDVSFSEEDKSFNPRNVKTYSEEEVEEILSSYSRYVGNDSMKADAWFKRNKK